MMDYFHYAVTLFIGALQIGLDIPLPEK